MLDGYGTVWPFNAPAVAYPHFSSDLGRGIALLPKSTTVTGGYVLDGWGGMHPFGTAPTLTNYPYFGFDIARGLTSWTFDLTSWRYSSTSHVGGWIIDGYGGLHEYQTAPAVSSGGSWNWDIARADTGGASGSGAR